MLSLPRKFIVGVFSLLLVVIAIKPVRAFEHPGIPFTIADLDALKAHIAAGEQPWKGGYDSLAADSRSQLTYTMQGPFSEVGRTPNVNLSQWTSDMQAIFNLSRMWYFTKNSAYAQKARDILIAWATTQTSFSGAESYLSVGDYAYRLFGGASILRGSWPGWTASDTTTCKNYFNNLYWPNATAPNPLRSANQGILQLITGVGVAVFNDDQAKFDQCLKSYRADAVGGLANSLPNGQVGDSGRDQGHAYGQLMHLSFIAEVFYKQGVDVYSSLDNRLLAAGEFYSRYNLGVSTPYVPFGTKYDYYWVGHGGAPNSSPPPPDTLNIIHSAYVVRKGMNAPYIERYRATRGETGDSFMFRKSADATTAATPVPLTVPAPTSSATTGFINADIGGATPAGSGSYSNGNWTVSGAGTNIWGSSDSFHFMYKQVSGDFTLIGKLTSLTGGSSTGERATIEMRDDLTATAPRRVHFGYIPVLTNGTETGPGIDSHQRGYTANSHNDPDELTHIATAALMMPHWLKIQRIGSRITVFHSADGGSWTPLQNAEYAGWTGTAYVGFGVCSRTNGTLSTATFTDVRVTGGDGAEAVKIPPAPSQIYGSPGKGVVPLRWMESFGATNYTVKRSTTSGGPYTDLATVQHTSYVDTSTSGGTTYYYVASASNSAGKSTNSPEESVTPAAAPVGSPVITSPNTATGTVGTPFSYTITATNSPISRNATGLPVGLSVNNSTGVISGSPTTAGSYSVSVSATNVTGTGNETLTLTVDAGGFPAAGTYSVKNHASGLLLDNLGITTNGANVGQWQDTNNNNQRWVLSYLSSNEVKLQCVTGGTYLDGLGRTATGSIVGQWQNSASNNQRWTIIDAGGGYFKLKNVATGLVLDVGGAPWTNGNAVEQWPDGTSPNAQWQFVAP